MRTKNLTRKLWRSAIYLTIILMGRDYGLAQKPMGLVPQKELSTTDPSGACPRNDVEVFSAATGTTFVCHAGTWTAETAPGSILRTTPPRFNVVTALGDSLTMGYGWGASSPAKSYPGQLMSSTGLNVINAGQGGYTSAQIRAVLFNPTSAAQKAGFWFIWAGRNNFADPTTVLSDVAAITSDITSAGGDYLVMSVINACQAGSVEWLGGSDYNRIISLNNSLASAYPSKYLDIRALLVAQANVGESADVAHDCPPTHLQAVGVHLNDAGYGFVASEGKAWLQIHEDVRTPNMSAKPVKILGLNPSYAVSGTGDAPVIVTTPPIDAIDGRWFCYTSPGANTGPVVMTFNLMLGTRPVVKMGGAALVAGDIKMTVEPCVTYHVTGTNSSQWELRNPQTTSSVSP